MGVLTCAVTISELSTDDLLTLGLADRDWNTRGPSPNDAFLSHDELTQAYTTYQQKAAQLNSLEQRRHEINFSAMFQQLALGGSYCPTKRVDDRLAEKVEGYRPAAGPDTGHLRRGPHKPFHLVVAIDDSSGTLPAVDHLLKRLTDLIETLRSVGPMDVTITTCTACSAGQRKTPHAWQVTVPIQSDGLWRRQIVAVMDRLTFAGTVVPLTTYVTMAEKMIAAAPDREFHFLFLTPTPKRQCSAALQRLEALRERHRVTLVTPTAGLAVDSVSISTTMERVFDHYAPSARWAHLAAISRDDWKYFPGDLAGWQQAIWRRWRGHLPRSAVPDRFKDVWRTQSKSTVEALRWIDEKFSYDHVNLLVTKARSAEGLFLSCRDHADPLIRLFAIRLAFAYRRTNTWTEDHVFAELRRFATDPHPDIRNLATLCLRHQYFATTRFRRDIAFRTAVEYASTDWSAFERDHPDMAARLRREGIVSRRQAIEALTTDASLRMDVPDTPQLTDVETARRAAESLVAEAAVREPLSTIGQEYQTLINNVLRGPEGMTNAKNVLDTLWINSRKAFVGMASYDYHRGLPHALPILELLAQDPYWEIRAAVRDRATTMGWGWNPVKELLAKDPDPRVRYNGSRIAEEAEKTARRDAIDCNTLGRHALHLPPLHTFREAFVWRDALIREYTHDRPTD